LIIYFDPSALIKRYVIEDGQEIVLERLRSADRIATAAITYVEMFAALARLEKERRITAGSFSMLAQQIETNWASYWTVELTRSVLGRAAVLARRHSLRAYDSVQLASALELLGDDSKVEFLSFDVRLNAAARREGLSITGR
jgi:predicted nucleic acid-binding protein